MTTFSFKADNSFDPETTRRMALTLMGSAGALVLATVNLIASAAIGREVRYADQIADALLPLSLELIL